MRTSKPIATISYNTHAFLESKLNELQRNGIIEFWAYVPHIPEDDETKEHIHLFMVPSKMLQTVDLQKEFVELDISNISHPLGVINFRSSKFDDWYLYGRHDPAYLASKGQSRKYEYSQESIVTSDCEAFRDMIRRINMLIVSPYQKMREYIGNGYSWADFFALGIVPINQIRQYEIAWQYLVESMYGANNTHRNNKVGHD